MGRQITHKEVDALNPLRRGEYRLYATRGESLADLVPNPKTWAHGPIAAVERFVERICGVEPLCGGKLQLAVIDHSGARWVHRPHADAERTEEQRAIGILNVGVQYAGTINANQVNSGGFTGRTLELDLNGTTVTIDNSYDTRLLAIPALGSPAVPTETSGFVLSMMVSGEWISTIPSGSSCSQTARSIIRCRRRRAGDPRWRKRAGPC